MSVAAIASSQNDWSSIVNQLNQSSVSSAKSGNVAGVDATASSPNAKFANAIFAMLDTDGDGKISDAEAKGGVHKAQELLGTLKTEKSDMTEYKAQAAAAFAKVDTNNDGIITKNEFAASQTSETGGAGEAKSSGNPLSSIMGKLPILSSLGGMF